ncbi:MAG: hypothetical protein C0501_09110 [Isosphaera sp.]|nr:hypothetical protein [Isosphaera sp.]
MRREDILSFTRANPFRPFVVILTSGERYEIRHPDMIVPTLGMATIGVPSPGTGGAAAEVVVHVSLVQILKIDHLGPPPAAPAANGPPG